MKIASVADVKAHFNAYLKSAARGPVIVTRNGKPVGALLATEDKKSWSVFCRLIRLGSRRCWRLPDGGCGREPESLTRISGKPWRAVARLGGPALPVAHRDGADVDVGIGYSRHHSERGPGCFPPTGSP